MAKRIPALVVLLALTIAGPVFGQGRWFAPYDRGVKAAKAERWQEAITQLERAIAADPRQGRNKPEEGLFTADYFPYFYLGLAHLKLGNLDEAEQNFDKTKQQGSTSAGRLPAALLKELNQHEADLAARRKPRPTAPPPAVVPPPAPPPAGQPPVTAPPPPPDPVRTEERRPEERKPDPPRPAEVDPRFTQDLGQAGAALSQRRFEDALNRFEALSRQFPDEFAKRGLSVSRDEAARGRSGELVGEGQQLLSAGRLTDAQSRFLDADRLVSGSAQAGIGEVARRRSEYSRLKGAIALDRAQGRLTEALQKLQQAREADPESFRSDGLDAYQQSVQQQAGIQTNRAAAALESGKLLASGQALAAQRRYADAETQYEAALRADASNTQAGGLLDQSRRYEGLKNTGKALYAQGKLEDAVAPLLDARRLDESRFAADDLPRVLDDINRRRAAPPTADQSSAPVREALSAYLQGNVARTVALLEPAAAGASTLDRRTRAHVHAYLGVAYADMSLVARKDEERTQLRQQALDQFRRVVAEQPDYQLPQAFVSPTIRELFDTARTKR